MQKKIIKITGASTGIGKEVALSYARKGHHVIISSRNIEKLKAVKAEAQGYKGLITCYQEDVTDLDNVQDIYHKVLHEIGPPDIVILNAGHSEHLPVEKFDPAIYQKLYEINQMGIIHGLAPAIKDMISRKTGYIAITASVAGYRGLPTATPYCMTKAALINLAEGLRPELLRHNVSLQLICPGFIKTPMTDKNNFKMPFLMAPDKAADIIVKQVGTSIFEINFPWFFCFLMRFYRLLPNKIISWCGQKMIEEQRKKDVV